MKLTKSQLKRIIREELSEYSRSGREPGGPGKKVSPGALNMKEWWNEDRDAVMSIVYGRDGRIPPDGETERAAVWEKWIASSARASQALAPASVDLAQDVE